MDLLKKTTACLALMLIPTLTQLPLSEARSASAAMGGKKYPAGVEPLSLNNTFFRTNDAPDFWKLVSFQAPQITNSACSLAAGTLVLNGFRGSGHLKSEETIFTQEGVAHKTGHKAWKKQTDEDGGGVSLREFEEIFPQALDKHGLSADVDVVWAGDGDPGIAAFEADLIQNQKSASDFIIINFDQGFVMDDESVGHFAVVGAYDSAKRRVLVMDPDKDWYEPYWVSLEKLHESLQRARGYMKIRLHAN